MSSLFVPVIPRTPVAVFDATHGQRNWVQTGFSSREMHTNFAGLTEMLCRLGFQCRTTGGEPLLQKNTLPLMTALCDAGKTVLLETSGAHDISQVDPRVHRIMDLKTPGSGEGRRNLFSNIEHLTQRDEVKFVIGSREDYDWSREQVGRYALTQRCGAVLFSPIFGRIDPREIVEWILADRLPVRFQLQMHKFIWTPTTRGV
jgi:7-carboxy-7-deazaguanine synthase